MQVDYWSKLPQRTNPRFWVITIGGGIAGFLAWCILDFALVRFAPRHIHALDGVLLLYPLIVFGIAAAAFRHLRMTARIALSLGAAIVATVVAGLLILFVGINIHLAIGGEL